MGALKQFWREDSVDNFTKYRIFMAIPINLLLWGGETWALRENLLPKLETFMHKSIRQILNINMQQVKDEHIRNEHIREKFFNIPTIRIQLACRQLHYLGKTIRAETSHPPKILLTAWCNNKRRPGGVLTTNKKLIVSNLRLLLSEVDKFGSLKSWAHIAYDSTLWTKLINHLRDPKNNPKPPYAQSNPTIDFSKPPKRNHHQTKNNTTPSPPSPPPPPPPSPKYSSAPEKGNLPSTPPKTTKWNRTTPPTPLHETHKKSDYNPIGVGRCKTDSLKVLGLTTQANDIEIKVKFRSLSRIYHPDKHQPHITGISNSEAILFFQMINNAYMFLRR